GKMGTRPASVQEPLVGLAGTLERWFEPIVRYIRHRHTHGPTEGFNNTIKLIQRMAILIFPFREFSQHSCGFAPHVS
ncbi:MAG: hypothetical protein ETSY2_34825, partial [Candidatus Entotheonella gemina]